MAIPLPGGWRRVRIAEVYENLFDGPHATPPLANDGPIFLGIGNITDDGHLDLSQVRHIAEEDFCKWTRRVTPRVGDIVFTYEATLNRYAMIPPDFRGCLGRRLALIRPDPTKALGRFVFYSFFGPDWRLTIENNRLSGATVDRIPLTHFPNFLINIPPLTIQQRVVSILSAYDDLIENNTRRIMIAEELAQRLYNEWFIEFRCGPGATEERRQTEIGLVPLTWRVATLSDCCARITDGSHWSPASTDTGRNMASVKDMRSWGFDLGKARRISEADYHELERNDCRPLRNDILIAKDGANLNKHTFLMVEDADFVVLSSIAILRPSVNMNTEFLVSMLRSDDVSDRIKKSATGAAIPRIILKDFKRLPVLLPPKDVQDAWSQIVGPLHQLCRNLFAANQRLRAARDLLLPRLISGEVDVSRAPLPLEIAAE